MKEKWDPRLTARENYRRCGLRSTANSGLHHRRTEPEDKPAEEDEQIPDPIVLFNIPTEPVEPCRHTINPGTTTYLRALIAKYDTDYKKMSRDIKLNYNQHTAAKLKGLCERLKINDAKAAAAAADDDDDGGKTDK